MFLFSIVVVFLCYVVKYVFVIVNKQYNTIQYNSEQAYVAARVFRLEESTVKERINSDHVDVRACLFDDDVSGLVK